MRMEPIDEASFTSGKGKKPATRSSVRQSLVRKGTLTARNSTADKPMRKTFVKSGVNNYKKKFEHLKVINKTESSSEEDEAPNSIKKGWKKAEKEKVEKMREE